MIKLNVIIFPGSSCDQREVMENVGNITRMIKCFQGEQSGREQWGDQGKEKLPQLLVFQSVWK